MQYKNTVEAIYIHIDEIQQLVAKFGAEGDVRSIDIDLTMDKLRNVYDLLHSLRKESSIKESAESVLREEQVSRAPGVSVAEKSTSIQHNVVEFSTENEEIDAVKTEEELPIKKEETQAEINSRVRVPKDSKALGETLSTEKPILNEELSQMKSMADLSTRLKTKPITSITAAIGLNEKFELIQNLFGGDKARYEHTMETLNIATNFNEAFEYLTKELAIDMNDPLAQRLLELVRRKLIVKKNE